MWFEILPSFGIIVAVMAAPSYICYGLNTLVIGKPYKRRLCTGDEHLSFHRDTRMTGNAHKAQGLEAITP